VRTLSRRTTAVAVAILVGVVATAALPGSAAVAAGSGTDWTASWGYYTDRSFEVHGTLPGVRLTGFSSDDNGTRSAGLSLEDTAADGGCARVYVTGTRDGRLATLADQMVCDGQPYATVATGSFTGSMGIALSRYNPAGGYNDKFYSLEIPDSGADPGLRQKNTGAAFYFTTDRQFVYSVQRTGAQVAGYGQQLYDDARSLVGTLKHTGSAGTCASGEATDYQNVFDVSTCTPGEQHSFSTEPDVPFVYDTLVQACTAPDNGGPSHCNWITVPEPW
jgi:hypothetical protein